MNVRYQIFVSSTYTDLFPARRKVTEHILSMNHIPAGMEMFTASGRQQWATIQKAIDNSDYYVLIVGERYGSISPDEDISYTEKEFNYATSKQIPTLCFLPGRNFSTSREHRETDVSKIEKLETFKSKIQTQQLCDFWETEDELVSKVSAALYKIFADEPGIGWIRGNTADPQALTKLVHAMEENKILRQKIQELEEKNKLDLPSLSLLINGHNCMSGPFICNLPELSKPALLMPDLKIEDIPPYLRDMISQDAIEEYNSSKPKQNEIDAHNEKIRFYQAAMNGELNFSIRNDGPVKANNVSINITIPDGIKILTEREVKQITQPELYTPPNIIQIAQDKYDSQQRINLQELYPFSRRAPAYLAPNIPAILNTPTTPCNLKRLNARTISGQSKSVRQVTIEKLSSDIYLVPLKRGTFSISIGILCDEYREWDVRTMDIIIE
jgi:hypothetical protein